MELNTNVQVPNLYMAWNVKSLATTDNPEDAFALTIIKQLLRQWNYFTFRTALRSEIIRYLAPSVSVMIRINVGIVCLVFQHCLQQV